MRHALYVTVALFVLPAFADTVLFTDTFNKKLADGWAWLRENPAAWRAEDNALRIHIQPGNMWGGSNNARNVLVRSLPDTKGAPLALSVNVENVPTAQYEQVNLVWYYDDSHMVKIGLEMVDGEICLVMGREEKDKTNTIAKPPIKDTALELRLTVRGKIIVGEYRSASHGWLKAGECEVPAKGEPKASLQCYQGPANAEHWAKITNFQIVQPDK